MAEDKVVYILFGDELAFDGYNIRGVFSSLKSAVEEMQFLGFEMPFTDFHIEEFWLRE